MADRINKDFGTLDSGFYMVPDAQWGFASSPVIHNGRVIVQADVQKGSFVAAFDVRRRRVRTKCSTCGDVRTFDLDGGPILLVTRGGGGSALVQSGA